MINAIADTYHLAIGIADVTNAFQNSPKASYEKEIIDCPPHYLSWSKLQFPTIWIEPLPDDHYVMEICPRMQGTKYAGRQWNTILNLVLSSLCFVKHIIEYAIYILRTTSTKYLLVVGLSIFNFLFDYSRIGLLKDFLAGLNKYFPVTSK